MIKNRSKLILILCLFLSMGFTWPWEAQKKETVSNPPSTTQTKSAAAKTVGLSGPASATQLIFKKKSEIKDNNRNRAKGIFLISQPILKTLRLRSG